ncbi:glycoside hydrolase family 32 protein [Cohnella rhizosphaerae]|uniref:beta-fructofuranosidase n=1 Tax=Cohnella rhizosphaerae TaxID=1457232 RepID=A0A9X4KWV0_9BACL|nr:glycoside hydrolase family 32 protein [Cohnella rhizosphaerae]MDG0812751.1 glycoside hydrolase family 32 protein [Cohnella rhizosphaerae]
MYLYQNDTSTTGAFNWGHISSHDLVHWRHHPDAIVPSEGDNGAFSGGAFVDDDGTAYLAYSSLAIDMETMTGGGVGIARSSDRHYDHWEKFDSLAIQSTANGITEVVGKNGELVHAGSCDPSNIWKKDGMYYLQTGNLCVLGDYGRSADSPLEARGDWTDLFRSADLKTWEYVDRFYERDRSNRWTEESEDDMCPSFLPLPLSRQGGAPSGKYLQLFLSHNRGCQYYIGEYRDDRFWPESHGRMTWADRAFAAPEALTDDKGRQIVWVWLIDNLDDETSFGWSGVYSLPRSLWLGADGTLRMAPVDELALLRYNAKRFPAVALCAGEKFSLDGIDGESCELRLTIAPGTAGRVGLQVRASPDGAEATLLYYDAESKTLVFDSTRSGDGGWKVREAAPFALQASERLELAIYIDKGVIEIFANERQAIARRVYPERADSTGVYLFCEGGTASFETIDVWEMMPSNPC